jgi:predicted phosphohydrolase
MDIFGSRWQDYVSKIEKYWRAIVTDDDTVIIPGDISWAIDLEEAKKDFEFINSLPGKKLLGKGNHDYWWGTMSKNRKFLYDNGFDTIDFLFNNAYEVENFIICGTRGWFFDAESDADKKVVLREAGRLKMSIDAAKATGLEPVVFLHYPPINIVQKCDEIYNVLVEEKVTRCYYGHLHGGSHHLAMEGTFGTVRYHLVSADYLRFIPKIIL